MRFLAPIVILFALAVSASDVPDVISFFKENAYLLDTSFYWQVLENGCVEPNMLQVKAATGTFKSRGQKKEKGLQFVSVSGTIYTDCNATAATRLTVMEGYSDDPTSLVFQGLKNATVSFTAPVGLSAVSCLVKNRTFLGGYYYPYYECPLFGVERVDNISVELFTETYDFQYTVRKTEFTDRFGSVNKYKIKSVCQDASTPTVRQVLLGDTALDVKNVGLGASSICRVKDSNVERFNFN